MLTPDSLSLIHSKQDIPFIRHALTLAHPQSCEYTLVNLYAYASALDTRQIIYNEHIYFSKAQEGLLYPCANEPVSPDELFEVASFLQQQGRSGVVTHVPQNYLDIFPETHDLFQAKPMGENWEEYVYPAPQLANLAGRHFASHRNKIAHFKKRAPAWHEEPVTPKNYAHVIRCHALWKAQYLEANPDAQCVEMESAAIQNVADAFSALKIWGLLVFDNQEPIGFTLSSQMNATTDDLHFKKALRGYPGLSALLFQQSGKQRMHQQWYNLEQDMGLVGLRNEKTLLRPQQKLQYLCLVPRTKENAPFPL